MLHLDSLFPEPLIRTCEPAAPEHASCPGHVELFVWRSLTLVAFSRPMKSVAIRYREKKVYGPTPVSRVA